MLDRARAHRRLLIVSSFVCIWLVWGSTFLTIRHVIQTIPPVLMCSLRLLAGGALPKAITDRIVTAVNAMPANTATTFNTNDLERVRSAFYLTVSIPQGAIQK